MRRLIHNYIGLRAATALRVTRVQERETGRLLLHMVDGPNAFVEHIQRYMQSSHLGQRLLLNSTRCRLIGALILNISYGYDTRGAAHDPLVKTVEA